MVSDDVCFSSLAERCISYHGHLLGGGERDRVPGRSSAPRVQSRQTDTTGHGGYAKGTALFIVT